MFRTIRIKLFHHQKSLSYTTNVQICLMKACYNIGFILSEFSDWLILWASVAVTKFIISAVNILYSDKYGH